WRIDVKLPAGLRAGVLGAQARYPLRIGSPPALHPGFDSNVAPFVLHPVITKTGANYDVTVANVQGAGAATGTADVTVKLKPDVGPDQAVTLELLSNTDVAMTTAAPPRVVAAAAVTFAVRGVAAGTYFVRVRVDGADSPLDLDAAGQPTDPKA